MLTFTDGREMNEKDLAKNAYELGRMEAVCRCAAIMMDEERPDVAKEIFGVMKIDRDKFNEIKKSLVR
jgi:hypothetical protein